MTQPPRVLIVEDQFFVAVDCELQLRAAGMECVGLATTASEALELAQKERPDLVVMDIRLASRVDGVQAAIVIYERLGIRCVFASAHADARTRELAQRACPLAWLDKPYTGEELVRTVRDSLKALQAASGRAPDDAAEHAIH
jgi:DNA-binding NarL/FixJ family response regulator